MLKPNSAVYMHFKIAGEQIMNARIAIRADFMRIAAMFSDLRNSSHPDVVPTTPSTYVLIEPHGDGVQIVATDGSAVCVQYDPRGYANRPYTVRLPQGICDPAKGRPINDTWLCANYDAAWLSPRGCGTEVLSEGGKAHHVADQGALFPVRVFDKPDDHREFSLTMPNWRTLIPSEEQIRRLHGGSPINLDSHYLRLIGRMYEDMLDCRMVHIYHDECRTYLLFPWRQEMTIILPHPRRKSFNSITTLRNILYPTTDDAAAGL